MHPAALPLSVTLAVLAAAVTHATWNAIAHGIRDQVLAFGLIGAGSVAAAVPVIAASPFPLAACWPYLLASVFIHVFYNLLLMRAYRYGDFGQTYPLARGTSPLVVTVLAAVFAAERPSLPQAGGVLVVSSGLAVLVLGGRRAGSRPGPGAGSRPGLRSGPGPGRAALLAAGGTGLAISAYTTVDGLGVRLSGSPAGYVGWLMLLESLCVPAWALARRRDAVRGLPARVLLPGMSAGALSVLAYGLVLWAQTRGALAPIAALRETSVIFGALIGTVVFREPFGRWRIAATVLVVLGVLLLNAS
jgi:drug/metabolite transporter (DMT)-like permease